MGYFPITKTMPEYMIRAIFILFISFLGCSDSSKNKPEDQKSRPLTGTCVGVSDGDTFTLLSKKKNQFKIRLAHIDCPEKGQPFGKNAKKFTSDFCLGKTLTIYHNGKKDRNGRVIGDVYDEQGVYLNIALVQAGLAWHFKAYSTNTTFAEEENKARSAQKGLWADPHALPPWEWRKR